MAPGNDYVGVTQSNTITDPNGPFRGIFFAAAGDISLVNKNGRSVTITSGALVPGVIHPIRFTRVNVTGTTATGIFGVVED